MRVKEEEEEDGSTGNIYLYYLCIFRKIELLHSSLMSNTTGNFNLQRSRQLNKQEHTFKTTLSFEFDNILHQADF